MDISTKQDFEPILMVGDPHGPDLMRLKQELQDLDERRTHLDRLIADAIHRQRFSSDPGASDKARDDERSYLGQMDRLMTRIRAVEGQMLLLRRRSCH